MKWIVHPFSYKDKNTEISVIHESDTHGMKSYGWFSDSKIFIGADSVCGTMPEISKAALRNVAEQLCNYMNENNESNLR